jgi:hypothetical protein
LLAARQPDFSPGGEARLKKLRLAIRNRSFFGLSSWPCATFLPVAVLTIDIAKSPVVGGIIGVPAALMVVFLTEALASKSCARGSAQRLDLILGCSIALFGAGFLQLFTQTTRHLPLLDQRADLQRLSELDKWLVNYANDRAWDNPGMSCDVISWFTPAAIDSENSVELDQASAKLAH